MSDDIILVDAQYAFMLGHYQLALKTLQKLKGGDQLQEALHIYEELKEKHGPSSLLLNGQAAALMGMNNWVEAEPILQEAIDMVSQFFVHFLR
ncbi:unnamed protein product [Trichobilharzia regenti]|nr:unnamed protein product [Trichobilharzia regenti]